MLFTRVNETSNREWEYRKEGIKFFNNELRLREKMIANINKAKNNGNTKHEIVILTRLSRNDLDVMMDLKIQRRNDGREIQNDVEFFF